MDHSEHIGKTVSEFIDCIPYYAFGSYKLNVDNGISLIEAIDLASIIGNKTHLDKTIKAFKGSDNVHIICI